MTKTFFAADAAPVDVLALEQAARRTRDAYVATLLSGAAVAVARRAGEWLRRRRAMAELSQLDTRLMADIGLDRAAFAAGVIRRVDEDRAQALAQVAPIARPVARHAAEPHLAPAVTPAAANDSRRAA